MRISTAIAATLAAAIFAFGPPAGAQDKKAVTIAHTATLAGGIPKIAADLGLFDKHGLNATLVQMDSANATATAIVSGAVDAAVSGPGELIAAHARGVDMVVIANIYDGLNGTLVLSKATAEKAGVSPDAPVAERLKALDGMLIASTSATSSFTVTSKAAIEQAGAKPRFVYMGQPAMQAALESGAVQGYMASAPFWTVPVLNGTGYAWVSGPKGEFPKELTPASSVGIYMMRTKYDADSDLAKRIAAVFADLSRAFGDNPAAVKAAIARTYPSMDPKSIDIFYDVELQGFMAQPLTVEDMKHEIAYVSMSGTKLPKIGKIDPASMLAQ
jgi:ABC-type nitrate/sulfonate/bicarbonate transport system substrate-binding protein